MFLSFYKVVSKKEYSIINVTDNKRAQFNNQKFKQLFFSKLSLFRTIYIYI